MGSKTLKISKTSLTPTIGEVIEFISRRFPKDDNWLSGNCYYFAVILQARFPQFQIFYDAVAGHFIAGAPNLDHVSESNVFSINYFDWTGAYFPSTQPIPLEEIKETDELWYERLVRDCIY